MLSCKARDTDDTDGTDEEDQNRSILSEPCSSLKIRVIRVPCLVTHFFLGFAISRSCSGVTAVADFGSATDNCKSSPKCF